MSVPAAIALRDGPGLGGGLRALLYRSRLWRWTLEGKIPADVACSCPDPWPGDEKRGELLMGGELHFAGQSLRRSGGEWVPERAGAAWLEGLHGFTWLRDLRQLGGDPARRRAREMIEDWIDAKQLWHPVTWRPDILGARLAAWLGHYEFIGGSQETAIRGKLLGSVVPQMIHLARTIHNAPPGGGRFTALKGLIYATCSIAGHDKRLLKAMKMLEREIQIQIRGDGGQVERSPQIQLQVLMDLVEIRSVLQLSRTPVPEILTGAIERMAPVLRFFRHGDGGLACFNDSNEDEAWLIDKVLALAEAKGPAPTTLTQTGFQRIYAGRTLILMDSGSPDEISPHTHAGTLSFEMSIGKERLIVNCGAHAPDGSEWRRAQRATAAHSTLTLDDTNSAELMEEGGVGRRAQTVTAAREDMDGRCLIDASHDGYVRSFGLIHRRRLYLDETGDDLRGEESLVGQGKARFAVRFHLHPKVTASLVQSGTAVLLKMPSGTGWRLRAAGGDLLLADSIYLGRRGEMKRAQQIVIAGDVGPQGTVIKWALRREGKRQ